MSHKEKQEWISGSEVGKRLGVPPQRIGALAASGVLPRRFTDQKYPWPATSETYARWDAEKRGQVLYTNGNFDKQLSDLNTQSPAPPIDKSDPPVMDAKQQAVDYANLSVGEQVINAIQQHTKGAEGTAYAWSRALKEAIAARSAMLELLGQEGKTLKREEVETWLYNISRHNRDIWLNWPQLVATEIAEELNVDANLLYGILS